MQGKLFVNNKIKKTWMLKTFAVLKLTGSELDLILDILVGCNM